jgi:hypothetical protein
MTRTILPLAALLLSACDGASGPLGAPATPLARSSSLSESMSRPPSDATPAAWGSGSLAFGATVEHLAFAAQQATVSPTAPFAASGEAEFHSTFAMVGGHIRITCLRVVGSQATLSGIVTRSNDPTIVGYEALFQVQDNDAPAMGRRVPDLASPVLLHAVGTGVDCTVPSEFDLVTFRGELEVQPEPAGT